jgi:hypothetical protein
MAIVFWVPPNMDEYLAYQPIACHAYPEARNHTFREGCQNYDLEVLGTWLPLRAYWYIGVASSAFYLPLFWVWPHYLSGRLMGLASLILAVAGASELTGSGFAISLIVIGMFFPMAYQTIADTGPVGFQCVLVFWIPILMRTIGSGKKWRRTWILSAILGLVTFAGLEQKPFFALILPSVIGLGAYIAITDGNSVKQSGGAVATVSRLAPRFLPALAVGTALSVLIFSSRTRYGDPYWEYLLSRSASFSWYDLAGQFNRLGEHFGSYLLNFGGFAHRTYGDAQVGTIAPTLGIWGLMVYAALRGGLRTRRFVIACFAAGICVAFLLSRNLAVWAGHHWVFVTLFPAVAALGGLAELQRTRPALARGIAFAIAVTNIAVLASTLVRQPLADSNWERLEAIRAVDEPEFAREHVVSHLDWGTFSIDALYGPREQLVTYNEPLNNSAELETLIQLAGRTGRRLAFVRRSDTVSNWAMILSRIPGLRRTWPGESQDISSRSQSAPVSHWEVWAER